MEKRKLFVLTTSICLILVFAMLPFTAACKPAPAPAPVLTAVSILPVGNDVNMPFEMFVERVNERAQGALTIDYLGGPEVVEGLSMGDGVQKGTVDMAYQYGGPYRGLVPAIDAIRMSQIQPDEQRRVGVHDIMQEEHNKAGLYYVGVDHGVVYPDGVAYVLTNKKVSSPQELAGQRMGDGTYGRYFIEAWGVVPVYVAYPDAYTALQTGQVDGWVFQLLGLTDMGFHEVTKYIINHPFETHDMFLIMNLDTWNSLTKPMQDLITEVRMEIEAEWPPMYPGVRDKSWPAMLAAGMEIIEFSPEDQKAWLEIGDAGEKAEIIRLLPELGPKLLKLLRPYDKELNP